MSNIKFSDFTEATELNDSDELVGLQSGGNVSVAASIIKSYCFSPGLPIWTFQAADSSSPNSGSFTTDMLLQSGTGVINMSSSAKDGSSNWTNLLGTIFPVAQFFMQLVDSTGAVSVFKCSITNAGYSQLTVVFELGGSLNWSGDYQVSFFTQGL